MRLLIAAKIGRTQLIDNMGDSDASTRHVPPPSPAGTAGQDVWSRWWPPKHPLGAGCLGPAVRPHPMSLFDDRLRRRRDSGSDETQRDYRHET